MTCRIPEGLHALEDIMHSQHLIVIPPASTEQPQVAKHAEINRLKENPERVAILIASDEVARMLVMG